MTDDQAVVMSEDFLRLRNAAEEIRKVHDEAARHHATTLAEVSGCIHAVALRQFESEERPLAVRLYSALAGSGVPLAALSVCGRGTEEIRFTKLLAYFLDPRKPHGLKGRILRAFLEPELQAGTAVSASLDWDTARVDAEYPLDGTERSLPRGSFIDILIRFPTLNVFIEEKILSAESRDGGKTQLTRYTDAITKNPALRNVPGFLIFLTPHGREASDPLWLPISHACFFRRAASLLGEYGITQTARHNLSCLLWDLLMGPMCVDEDTMSELRQNLGTALRNPRRSVDLKRWCATRIGPDAWTIILKTAEVLDESEDE